MSVADFAEQSGGFVAQANTARSLVRRSERERKGSEGAVRGAVRWRVRHAARGSSGRCRCCSQGAGGEGVCVQDE